MNGPDFRKGLFGVLARHSFTRQNKLMRASGSRVVTLVDTQMGFGDQCHINVGFWFDRIGGDEPDRIERTHMYFRLERLFPSHREVIVSAGELDDPGQSESYKALLTLLASEIAPELRRLCSEHEMVEAYRAARFDHGLVTKSARNLLLSGN